VPRVEGGDAPDEEQQEHEYPAAVVLKNEMPMASTKTRGSERILA
jgi:hypothetical protein